YGRQPLRPRARECRLVGLWRMLRLEATEADAHDAALAVPRRMTHDLVRLLEREASDDIRREPDLDAEALLRLLCPVAVPGEDLVPAASAPDALARREDPLDVDGAVRGGLGCVVEHDLAEVLLRPERVGRQHPDLDEMGEVAELVQ